MMIILSLLIGRSTLVEVWHGLLAWDHGLLAGGLGRHGVWAETWIDYRCTLVLRWVWVGVVVWIVAGVGVWVITLVHVVLWWWLVPSLVVVFKG